LSPAVYQQRGATGSVVAQYNVDSLFQQQDQKSKRFIWSLRNQATVTQMSRKMWQSAAIFETKEKKSGEGRAFLA
jgi:hypothetical protein